MCFKAFPTWTSQRHVTCCKNDVKCFKKPMSNARVLLVHFSPSTTHSVVTHTAITSDLENYMALYLLSPCPLTTDLEVGFTQLLPAFYKNHTPDPVTPLPKTFQGLLTSHRTKSQSLTWRSFLPAWSCRRPFSPHGSFFSGTCLLKPSLILLLTPVSSSK